MLATLVAPHFDKGFSTQIERMEGKSFLSPESIHFDIMALPEVKAARGFLQSHSRDFLMIEYWTENQTLISQAHEAILELVKKVD